MLNRTEKRFRSLSLKEGFRFGYYPDLAIIKSDLGDGADTKITEIVNRQISAHNTATQSRDQFTDDLMRVTGFPFKIETYKNKSGKELTRNGESEKDYVDRLRQALLKGEITHFTPVHDLGTKAESKAGENDGETDIAEHLHSLAKHVPQGDADIEAWLQKLADLRLYVLDARITERTTKEKGLPKYALEGATAILAGGEERINKWRKVFAKRSITLRDTPDLNDEPTKVAFHKHLAESIQANELAEQAEKYV